MIHRTPRRLGRLSAALARAVALLMQQPRTAGDLADALGLDIDTCRRWMHELAEAGLVRTCGTRKTARKGAAAFLWEWAR